MSKDIYSLFNCTGGEIPNAEPLDDTEVKKYMERFENDTNTQRRIPFVCKSAIAASLALLIAAGGTFGYSRFTDQSHAPFVMTVNAAEITQGGAVVAPSRDCGLSISENDSGDVAYSLALTLECTGSDIKSVTYTLDKDVISLVSQNGEASVINGTTAENTGEKKAYTSVTFDYNAQNSESVDLEILGVGDPDITADKEALFSYNESDLEAKCDVLGRLIDNTIHCTAEYSDGTKEVKDIRIGTEIKDFSEAYPDEFNAMPQEDRQEKDIRGVFVTYSAGE